MAKTMHLSKTSLQIVALIEQEMKIQGLTSSQLAAMTGVSIRSIEYWLRRDKNISLENANKVLKALETKFTLGK